MQEHFTVIDYDHRGYGQSDRPAQKYTMDTWADDLAGLLDALGVERCHVHGGSMGGFIACLFAAKYPERVDRLVFNGAVAKCDWMARTHFHLWKRIAQDVRARLRRAGADAPDPRLLAAVPRRDGRQRHRSTRSTG